MKVFSCIRLRICRKISIFTSYKEIETDDSAGYNGTDNQESAGADSRSPGDYRSLVESNGKLLEQTDALQQKIQELLSQIAWLNRQLFGRRSEKLAALDPNQLSLFDPVPATGQSEDIREEDSSAAVPSKAKPDGKKKESRRNRELL